ncbi:MAG: hypothetical protein V3R73_01265, partial [Sphingomonadales bacterium]
MRRIAIVLAAVLQFIVIGPAMAGDTIFLNATVITMDEAGVIARANVHVSGGRIVAVEPDLLVDMKSDTVLVDATGKFLIPGLAEMHGHLPFAGAGRQAAEDTLFLYVARGVTTVRGMLGNPVQFELRAEINAGTIAGPNLYLAAPSLNGNSVTSPAQAKRLVIKYHGQGWDLQKIHPGLSLAEYDAAFDAADALDFPVGGHVPSDVPLPHAIERGQISVDHLDGFLRWLDGANRPLTEADLQKAVDLVKDTGVWLVPTQALFNLFLEGGDYNELKVREELRYVTPTTRNNWRRRLATLQINQLAAQNRQKLLKA